MKYSLVGTGGESPDWVIKSEDLSLIIRCKSFEIFVPTKTVISDGKHTGYLEVETDNTIIIQGSKIIIK